MQACHAEEKPYGYQVEQSGVHFIPLPITDARSITGVNIISLNRRRC
jgi:hypothetical protein